MTNQEWEKIKKTKRRHDGAGDGSDITSPGEDLQDLESLISYVEFLHGLLNDMREESNAYNMGYATGKKDGWQACHETHMAEVKKAVKEHDSLVHHGVDETGVW